MTNRFMISVAAAALIAGTSFAYAQGTGTAAKDTVGRFHRSSKARRPASAAKPRPLRSQPSRPRDRKAPRAGNKGDAVRAEGRPKQRTSALEENVKVRSRRT